MSIEWNHCSEKHGCDRLVAECSACGSLVHKDNREAHERWHAELEIAKYAGPFGNLLL